MSRGISIRVVAAVLGTVFLWASVAKLLDVNAFIDTLGNYGLVWEPLLGATAWMVIVAELVSAVGLLGARRWAATTATGLLLVFLGVLGYGIALGLDVECGCFGIGKGGGLSLWQAVGVDCGLLIACCWLQWSSRMGLRESEGMES